MTAKKGSKGCTKSGRNRSSAQNTRYIAEGRRARNKRARMKRTLRKQPANRELAALLEALF
jgi:hypothetical protein